ncbi:MAG: phytoene/squalene synthase family protein [Gammaproteobacteria bacterium]|nr:phytoene/squalene synthase family protein [Gammaproteobacteria bacterium]MBI5615352.1 phytoene/squalene synthase family protein [Gammaproteobacteria bacterium]
MATSPSTADEAFQNDILQHVSRTFALTIPVLPPQLSRAVANAYLLCRIADTIEDDADLGFDAKRHYSQLFLALVRGEGDIAAFGPILAPQLAAHTLDAERELIAHTDAVLRITHSLNAAQREALERCVRIMTDGMVFYQGQETLDGVENQPAMDRYCYYVAGVVGEMLTDLFVDHCPELAPRKPELMRLAVSFGQGLQMTNILKDIWEDRARGACWLPRDEFVRRGIQLSRLAPGEGGAGYQDALRHLVGIAHGHLRNALGYTLEMPVRETGIRNFCLWALGMAVLTLRKIDETPNFTSGQDVKISRRSVKTTVMLSRLAVKSNVALRALFAFASLGLPQQRVVAQAPALTDSSAQPRQAPGSP